MQDMAALEKGVFFKARSPNYFGCFVVTVIFFTVSMLRQ